MKLVTAGEALQAADPNDRPAVPLTGVKAAVAVWAKYGERGDDIVGDSWGMALAKIDPGLPFPAIMHGSAYHKIHPFEARSLSVGEVSVAMSFPRQFAVLGSRRDALAVVGNCVPPFFMAAVAGAVRGVLR